MVLERRGEALLPLTVHAIVLKRTDSGESDRRLTLLTREAGKLFAVAKGARKAASRLAGISDPLSSAVMDLAPGKRTVFITQAQPLSSFRGLRADFERLSFALALCELYAAVIPLEQPQPEAYDLLEASLRAIESHAKPLVALVWAQVSLLNMEGFLPQFETCVINETPVALADPLVSPSAGGFISEDVAERFPDRFRVRAEVLYGLVRLGDITTPPANLKFAEETIQTLFPFWRQVTETQLPANEAILAELRHPMGGE